MALLCAFACNGRSMIVAAPLTDFRGMHGLVSVYWQEGGGQYLFAVVTAACDNN